MKSTAAGARRPLTSIIVLTYNNLLYNKRCINSVRRYTKKGSYELIVIDNDSRDGTLEWLRRQPDIKLIANNLNVGYPKGCNQGIRAASGDVIVLLNNDAVVTRHWLDNLLTALYSADAVGAVGPETSYRSYGQQIAVPYRNLREMQSFAAGYNRSDPEKWEAVIKLVGYCVAYKRELFDRVGLLDDRFSPGNFDDDDLSLRAARAGYRLLLCHDTFIHHYGSKSFLADAEGFNRCLRTNHAKFVEKWGFLPAGAFDKKAEIACWIRGEGDAPLKVLEVGCGCGAMLLHLKNRLKNAELYGVEPNRAAAEVAGAFAAVQSCAWDDERLFYPDGYFDCIVFSDVLTKLRDPWALLSKFRGFLREGGQVLAAIPNVLHYSVLLGLLGGRWAYADSGILDRANLRFFTPADAETMFREAGFKELTFGGTTLPGAPQDPGRIDRLGELADVQVRPLLSIHRLILSGTA